MNDLQPYIEMLRVELMEQFANIDSTISPVSVLRNHDFKRLAGVVSKALEDNETFALFMGINFKNKDDLSASAIISDSTIERVLTGKWIVKQPIEKRVLVTLNKLTIFLGYRNWEDFFYQKNALLNNSEEDISRILIAVVNNADKAEFRAYKALPEIDVTDLEKYFLTDGPAYKRIYNVLVRHKFRQWVLTDPTNPSDYQTYSAVVKEIAKDTAIVVTDEWWLLRWFDLTNFKTPVVYNIRNTQTFTLKKTDENIWKVFATEYPTEGAVTYLKES